MKRNKPETHFRLKPYLKKWIDEIAKIQESTMTSVVEDALEKGLTWRIKMIRKELDPNFLVKEQKQAPVQQNIKPQPKKEATQPAIKKAECDDEPAPSNEEIKKQIEDLYKKHQKTG